MEQPQKILVCVSSCTHAQAKATPDAPPLNMPEPPPREVEIVDAEVPAPVPLVEEPARHAPTRPRPAPTRAESPRQEPPKPEPPKPEPVLIEPAKPIEEPPKPLTTLQTTPTGAEGEVERGIRGVLTRATNDLKRIDYRALNPEARTQYDTAKRFVNQAEDALRAKNLMFAKSLADKAAALAAQLGGK